MDVNDLLYTNQFEEDDTGQFQNYMREKNNPTAEYLRTRMFEGDAFNVQQGLGHQWPTGLKRNPRPLMDPMSEDLTKNRYRKEITTNISIYSKERDISKYLYSDEFFIPFPKQFTNIEKLVIRDIVFPNSYPPINNSNNLIAWQYASKNDLLTYNIDQSIIPQPNIINNIEIQTIFYSELISTQIVNEKSYQVRSVSSIDNSQYLVYQTNISEGYYSTEDLKRAFEKTTNQVVHGASYLNLKELELTNITPLNTSNLNNLFIPTRTQPWKYGYEEPYMGTQLNVNTSHHFTIDIDTTTHEVRVVNRMEKIRPVAIQTFPSDNYEATDIFYHYSLNPNKGNSNYLDSNYIYITLPYQSNIIPFYYNATQTNFINPFPLVLTGLENDMEIGGIKGELLNYTTFFDINIYTQNGYIEVDLDSISTYKYWDTIEIVNDEGKLIERYVRFALKLSNGLINSYKYNPYGYLIRPTDSVNYLYRESLKNYLEKNQIYQFEYRTNISADFAVGRALLFRWIFDIDEEQFVDYEVEADYEKRRSIMKLLGWSVPNKTYNLVGISDSPIYKFVHSNIQNKVYQGEIEQNITNTIFRNNSPQRKMNLQLYNQQFYFKSYDYIYMKISPDITKNGIENALIQAKDNTHLTLNSIYIVPEEITTGIGENEVESSNPIFGTPAVYVKDQNQLFTKILISNLPNQTTPELSLKSESVLFYDKPLENLSGIYVEILSQDSKKLRLGIDYSFTFEIHEIRDMLKETNMDTKRNEIFMNGLKRN